MALNLDSYDKTQWEPTMPITQDRMNKLENGVYVNREAIKSLDSTVDSATSSIQSLNAAIAQRPTITEVNSLVEQGSGQGTTALTAITSATTGEDLTYGGPYASLAGRFRIDEGLITAIKQALGQTVNSETNVISDIYGPSNTVASAIEAIRRSAESILAEVRAARVDDIANPAVSYQSLYLHLKNIDSNVDVLMSNVSTILAAAGQNESGENIALTQRFAELANLKAEVEAAHRAVEEGQNPDTLAKRFGEIESAVSSLRDNKVNVADIIDDLVHNDSNKPLSANMGKTLKDTIGGTYSPTNTVASAIATAQSTAESNAESYADTNKIDKTKIYNGLDYETQEPDVKEHNVLDALQGKALKDLIDGLDNSTDARLDTIETELNNARIEIGTDEESGDPVMSTLDQRLDAMDTTTAGIRADLTTVISELGMTDTNGLKTMGTRIDDLADNVAALATELDMQMNEDKIVDTNSRIDSIETVIDHVQGENDEVPSGLKQRISALESDLDTAENNISDLDTRLDAIDGNTTGTLINRVNAAEAAIITLQNEPKSATEIVISLPQTGDPNKDYLLGPNEDGKYFYYKWIVDGAESNWKLISGGGSGEGNTSGFDLTAAEYDVLQEHEENTDYYVTRTDGIHHYRYVPIEDAESGETILTEVEIGQFIDVNKIKRYNIATVTGKVDGEDVTYLNLYQYDYNETNNNIDTERQPFTQIVLPKGGGGSSSTSVNKLTRIGDQTIQKIVNSKVLLRIFYSSWDSDSAESSAGTYTLTTGNTVVSSGTLNSGAQDVDLSQGWQDNTAGFYEFDVTDYCNVGNTVFNLTVTVNGVNLGKEWTVNIIDLHLESDAPDVLLINATEPYNFPYTAFGALTKTLHVIIDNNTENEIEQTLSSVTSGRAATITIPAQEHGSHKIEMYLTATIGGVLQTTPSIIREYIWYDINNTEETLILASPKDGQTITAQQYSTIEIPYQVYKKDATSITVDYYIDDTLIDSVILEDTNTGILSYLATDKGAHALKIMVDNDENTALKINLNITQLDINISPIDGAIIDFDPTMLTNSSANRLPSWTIGSNTYSLTDSANFNWSDDSNGGGYKKEEDGKALVIKAGTYVDLNYPLFSGDGNNNILTRGAELKLIFKTKAVRKVDAIWLQSVGQVYEKDVGLQLSAHSGWLKTTKAVNENAVIEPDENGVITLNGISYNIWKPNTAYTVNNVVVLWDESDEDNHQLIFKCIQDWDNTHDVFLNSKGKVQSDYWISVGKISTNIAATDSYLYLPYSEQDKIELDINVDSTSKFIMSYEDGVPNKVYAYQTGTGGDMIYHNNTIRIGSPDCDVYLYHLRIYNKSLATNEILQNFIADGSNIDEKVNRYNRNSIYWDPTQNDGQGAYFPSPSPTATLDPIKLAEVMPNVKVLMLDTPVFTTSKKDFVKNSTLRCIHAEGGNVYRSRGDADNWLFTNGFHSGQGTTSDNYGQSARNVDFLFEVDGEHWPTKSKNMAGYKPSDYPDYKSTVYVGKDASTWNAQTSTWEPAREPETNEKCDDWKGDNCKVALTETSVPNNYFNLKVNVASSENVNNALFQKRYDDFLVYTSPAQTSQIVKHRAAYAALGQDPSKIKVKNSMEFVPAVLFVRENGPIAQHVEFNDTNWHFYALGNIGDSKKTDYTRAYNPDDMNEFTCENSDNNTNNGQFQSGVFMYNGHEAIETDYRAWSATNEYVQDNIVVNDGTIYKCNVSNATTGTWVANEWQAITYTNWTEEAAPYFAPRTNPNPMEYKFSIKSSQWNVQLDGEYLNRKHKTLVEEEFDGDHSFEFRYACCGDYRDGDLINDTTGDADAQEKLNHDVMLAFYEWVITADKDQFIDEAPQWIVKSAMEFFYAYTHYYTMMDNRAKNTFWHFAQTGTYVNVSRPVKALLHVYEESTDGGNTWQKATGTEIDPNKQYRTQYAFDLWAYDMDTALGIDNNGQLSFPYGKEDDDYRVDGVPTSGYAFNGAGSIFWRRLKTSFASEIADVMNSAQNCFKAEDLISEFDEFQNCFPEEIWRLDIERKYIRTFTGASIDGSITIGKKNPRFLTAMMQGRKKYQRRQWIRNQSLYFNSKYRLKDITNASNTTEFNVITPADVANVAVTPNYDLKLVPYQDMYINVTIGNGGPTPSKRVKAGETYILPIEDYTAANFGETRIYIYGFSGISEVGNLASMYPYSFTLNALDHLKRLDMGTDNSGYVNANLTSLPFTEDTELPLLESINIKNCHSLSGNLSLNRANNLTTVEATGTTITGVSLPQYTHIETLHLPSTVASLVLYGARNLNDLQIINNNTGAIDYSGLFNLNIYDSDYSTNIDWIDIATEIIQKQSNETEIALLKLSTAMIGNIQELEPLKDFKAQLEEYNRTIELSGTINITGTWSEIEVQQYAPTTNVQVYDSETDTYNTTQVITSTTNAWSDLILNARGTKQTKYEVLYYVDNTLVKTLYIDEGSVLPDIYANGMIEKPTKARTARETYDFGVIENSTGEYIPYSGWKLSGAARSIYEDGGAPKVYSKTVVEAVFTASVRTYQVRWYLDEEESKVIKTSAAINYGEGYTLEAPTVKDIHDAGFETCSVTVNGGRVNYSLFTGWEKLPTNINPSAEDDYYKIHAVWETDSKLIDNMFSSSNLDNLTPEQLLALSGMDAQTKSDYGINDVIGAGTRVTYNMGTDNDLSSGTTLISSVLQLDSAIDRSYQTDIQPLRAGQDAFTLAIDYCFNPEATQNLSNTFSTLVSCYYSDTNATVRNGFSLFYGRSGSITGPRVGFGDMYNNSAQSVMVGNNTNLGMRNMVVLRHPAGEPVLYVYSGLSNSITMPSEVKVTALQWQNYNSDAHLCFGFVGNDAGANDTVPTLVGKGKGKIYWAKYWSEDLGQGECKRIASWPHEPITFGIYNYNSQAATTANRAASTSSVASLGLATLNTPTHGAMTQSRVQDSTFSWASSNAYTLANSRVFLGLPTKLQAILCKASIKYSIGIRSGSAGSISGGYSYGLQEMPGSVRNYVGAYSLGNISRNSTYAKEDSVFPWYDATNVTAYTYSATSSWVANPTDSQRANYTNIRFPSKPINATFKVFRESTDTVPTSTTFMSSIGTMLSSGDICITYAGKAYMYVTTAEASALGLLLVSSSEDSRLATTTGGWIRADEYWTRSIVTNNGFNFSYVHEPGLPEIDTTTSASGNGLKISYVIAI